MLLQTLSCLRKPRGYASASDALTGPGPETLSKSMVSRFESWGCVWVKRDDGDDAKVEDFGRREENRVEDRIYLERCTTTRGAVVVSVDPVSTS
jgi:hypothetical protein